MKDAPRQTLGEYIRTLREEKDLSLRELGKMVDLSAPFLSDVELNRRHPSEKVLTALAPALGTTVERLREYDFRPTADDLTRLVSQSPEYAFAFRKMLDKQVTPEELVRMVEKKDRKP